MASLSPHSPFHLILPTVLTDSVMQARAHSLRPHPRQKTNKIPRCSVMVGGRDTDVRTEESDGEGEVGEGG